ncbi:MAG TPA: hypothetical protein VFG86_17410 [Chloroflexota bacterium]|nr:hypothetical protein [Chloroflexota bacterium]
MWLLIVPVIIVLVLVLGVGTLTAALFGALGNNWPWLLIAAGVWMFWHQDGRHRYRRRRHTRTGWEPRTIVVEPKPSTKKHGAKVEQKPTPITPLRKPELPIEMQVKVEQIRRKVDVLLGFADRFPPFSKDLYIVQQTASDYLPRTIDAYLALPPDATDRPIGSTGKTPRQELQAQLDLLDAKLDDIAQDLERQDVDRMLANRRFLEDRFGKHEQATTKASA